MTGKEKASRLLAGLLLAGGGQHNVRSTGALTGGTLRYVYP